ncbi:MAG: tRNA-dihydrouridine synthase [Alysiella sp.]|uniref:tRNA dihydrouridine synthase n=1 Tax=Alysiella sp. TaxID=1872483 RepID=UPI0026DCA696|nr:tRNA-dihydrouridine synthase [Alysiella sp.]MDO4433824.1 tRNA-dihydrouridine synthase [Alysiella sp.]
MNHHQKQRLILAPMQGLCDDVMRDLLTRIGGYDECVSEFVRITHTVHSKQTWLRHVPEIAYHNHTFAGVPCVAQILGSDKEMMAVNALEAVLLGVEKIDVNFGCPAPTVNKHQGGAVLLKEPERVYQIVRHLRDRLPENIVLSAKMRLGYENTDLCLQNAQAIEQGGASLLTVHARTKVQGYEPPAHWAWLRAIQTHIGIPVVANGDVFSVADYLAICEQSGCHDVMLGRGAVMVPDLARQIKQYLHGETVQAATFNEEIMDWIRLFFALCREKESNNKYPVARLKQWLGMMKKVYPEAGQLFEAIRVLKEADEVGRVLATFQAA